MSELTGAAWLNSPQKRAYERRVLRPLIPLIVAGTAVAKTGVIVIERDSQPVKSHNRSLTPGEVFVIQKIGDPEPKRPVSRFLRKTMLDELPQLSAAWRGQAALIGPRGTLPEHREWLFDMLGNGHIADDWRRILSQQKPGLISTYALDRHSQPGLEDDYRNRLPSELADEALVRYEADKRDFTDASLAHSQLLVHGFVNIVRQKILPE